MLARTINDDGYAMLDADTGEVRETWPDGTPAARDFTLRLTGWYGSAGDPAAYWMEEFEEEGRFGELNGTIMVLRNRPRERGRGGGRDRDARPGGVP